MEFAEKVKHVREQLQLSQETLAKELGVSFATVNRWESGKFMPSYKAMKAFEAFCVNNGIKNEEI